jgi:hypothetical protein
LPQNSAEFSVVASRSSVAGSLQVTFGPSRRRWFRRIATMAAADFRSAPSNFRMHGPAFGASFTDGYANRISPDKGLMKTRTSLVAMSNVLCPRPSSSSTCAPSSSLVSRCHARSPGVTGLMKFLFVTWRVLARMWLATILCQLTEHIRRLPFHGLLPPRSCPRLVLNLSLGFTFGRLLPVSNYWN